jgi:hypothetical protein
MIGEVIDLAAAVVDIIDRQVPGWEARARRRLARLEARLPTVQGYQRRQRIQIRIAALRGLLGRDGA